MFVRARLGVTLVLAIAVTGCIAPPPATPPAPNSTNSVTSSHRVEGTANLTAGPFAGAAVRVFRIDNDALVGEGVTDERGAFAVAVPAEAMGFALRIDVSKDGKSLGAVAGRMAATPLGYFLAQATGGSVISDVKVNLASTLALRAFIARFKSVTISILPPGAKEIPVNLLAKLLALYKKTMDGAEETLAGLDMAALESAIAQGAFTPLELDLLKAVSTPGSAFEQALKAAEADLSSITEDTQPTAAPTTEPTSAPAATPEPIIDGVEEAAPLPGVVIEGSFDVPMPAPTPTTPPTAGP